MSIYLKGNQNSEKNKRITVEKEVTGLCKKLFFIKGSKEIRRYRDHLFSQSISKIINLLTRYVKIKEQEDFVTTLTDHLVELFFGDLQRIGFNLNSTKEPYQETAFNLLLKILNENDILQQGYRLAPVLQSPCHNNCMIVLGTLYANLIRKKPAYCFDYLIKVGLTREVANFFYNINSQIKDSIANYINYTGIIKGARSPEVARLSAGFLYAFFLQRNSDQKKVIVRKTCWQGSVTLLSPSAGKLGTTLGTIEGKAGLQSHFNVDSVDDIERSSSLYPLEFVNATKTILQEHDTQKNTLYFNRIDTLIDGVTGAYRSWGSVLFLKK